MVINSTQANATNYRLSRSVYHIAPHRIWFRMPVFVANELGLGGSPNLVRRLHPRMLHLCIYIPIGLWSIEKGNSTHVWSIPAASQFPFDNRYGTPGLIMANEKKKNKTHSSRNSIPFTVANFTKRYVVHSAHLWPFSILFETFANWQLTNLLSISHISQCIDKKQTV